MDRLLQTSAPCGRALRLQRSEASNNHTETADGCCRFNRTGQCQRRAPPETPQAWGAETRSNGLSEPPLGLP